MTIVLPGGQVGIYEVRCTKNGFGFNAYSTLSDVQFEYILNVTGISHTSGSVFGGLDLTITGNNFDYENTDNIVINISV